MQHSRAISDQGALHVPVYKLEGISQQTRGVAQCCFIAGPPSALLAQY